MVLRPQPGIGEARPRSGEPAEVSGMRGISGGIDAVHAVPFGIGFLDLDLADLDDLGNRPSIEQAERLLMVSLFPKFPRGARDILRQ